MGASLGVFVLLILLWAIESTNPFKIFKMKSPVSSVTSKLGAPSPVLEYDLEWDAARSRLRETEVGKFLDEQRTLRSQGEGLPSPDATYRLFGKDERDVRVVLYKDAASWCPYCQKVWILLEMKQIPYLVPDLVVPPPLT